MTPYEASFHSQWIIIIIIIYSSIHESNYIEVVSFFFIFSVTTVTVEAVLGRSATMPCDIEPDARDDRVYMVLWFRESMPKPLYK